MKPIFSNANAPTVITVPNKGLPGVTVPQCAKNAHGGSTPGTQNLSGNFTKLLSSFQSLKGENYGREVMKRQAHCVPPFEWIPAIAGMITPFLILVLLMGCAGRNPLTIYRPNARTPLEEKAYNALKVSDRLITEAEKSNEAGTLPEFMRPIVNGLIDAHELALKSFEKYAPLIGMDGEQMTGQELEDLLLDLDRTITSFFTRGSP